MGSELLLLFSLFTLCSSWSVAIAASPEETALRNAILSAGKGSVILTKDVFLTADLPELPDNKTLKVIGRCGKRGKAKCTIHGGKKYQLFRNAKEAPVFLVLDNLIITGTKATNETAAVSIGGEGTTLAVNNVKFSDNARALDLYIVSGIITKTLFMRHTDNAVYTISEEGLGDDLKFVNCWFSGNKAAPGEGGAAIFVGRYASITVDNCKFSGNSADYRGGALRFFNSYGKVTRSVFFKNTATESGGAITVFNSGLDVKDSSFQENVALNSAGGAVRVGSEDAVGSLATFAKTTFLKNKARNSLGGAFELDTESEIVLCKTTFADNVGKRDVASNVYVVGPGNTISTNPLVRVPAVTLAPDAVVDYKKGTCA